MKNPFSLSSLAERWQRRQSAEAAARAASHLTAQAELVLPFREARSRFKLEMTRARRYEDPITLAAVRSETAHIYRRLRLATTNGESRPAPSPGEKVPDEVRQLAVALMSPLVRGSIRITDLVAYDAGHDDHLILFTETSREGAWRPLDRLRERMEERFAVELRAGLAEFPADGYTLDDLVEAARGERSEDGTRLDATGSGGAQP